MREDWTECCFEDILDYEQPTKYIVNSTDYNDAYKMPVLTAGKSFIKGYTNETEGIFENLPTIIFDDFTTASQYVDFKFKVKSSAMKILVPTSKLVNMRFAFYCMQVNQIRNDTHKRYWISVYAKKKFLLPSLVEQKAIISKIEELFSDLDKGIDDLKKAKDQLVIYRQAVLKKAFEGELTKEWREKQINLPSVDELIKQIKVEREKHYKQQIEDWKKEVKVWEQNGEKGLKPIKPKSLKLVNSLKEDDIKKLISIPKVWKYHYLAYAGDLGRGKSKHRPRNDKRLFGGPYPFFQTSEVKAQEIISSYTQTYSEFGLKQSKLWPAGTLCITIAANIAETGFLGIDACFPDSIVGYTPYESIIDIKYIDYFFQSAKRRISAYAPATAQKNINLTTLENLLVPYCSKNEQGQVVKEIESRLSICEKVEQSINDSLEKAKALRQSILKKAFEGKLLSAAEIARCKKETDYESASVLLAKIKVDKKNK
ncbi:restriction endonuclease subunit S [Flavobacterium lacus]|uniref:Type I restriction enzyme S subunit n=1 Tax=Flavobacterium lacus TaxID=1353778 RepID=A0A328X6A5_9FLAO|nr:restriction endonuclease subunit S [Flavobacterium lacus]RAR50868.1 type I restriction enzyme S subunit [Flavobacterium lacus]